MLFKRLIWLALPFAGLLELLAHAYFAQRAPSDTEWTALRGELARLHQSNDLVIVTPAWAEPLARRSLGSAFMPLADVARSGTRSYATAVEVSLFGERSSELEGFRELENRPAGPFLLRRLENPQYRRVLYAFVDHVRPGELFVGEWTGDAQRSCEFTDRARPSAGGLGGHVTYPRERYRCSGGEAHFVGVTVFDDQQYRPRRCIYAHPLSNARLRLRFPNVPRGRTFWGSAGLSYLVARDGIGTPVELTAFVNGNNIGRHVSRDQNGFVAFEFPIPASESQQMEVVIEVVSASPVNRDFCFIAEVR
jgi:hypothetical protein